MPPCVIDSGMKLYIAKALPVFTSTFPGSLGLVEVAYDAKKALYHARTLEAYPGTEYSEWLSEVELISASLRAYVLVRESANFVTPPRETALSQWYAISTPPIAVAARSRRSGDIVSTCSLMFAAAFNTVGYLVDPLCTAGTGVYAFGAYTVYKLALSERTSVQDPLPGDRPYFTTELAVYDAESEDLSDANRQIIDGMPLYSDQNYGNRDKMLHAGCWDMVVTIQQRQQEITEAYAKGVDPPPFDDQTYAKSLIDLLASSRINVTTAMQAAYACTHIWRVTELYHTGNLTKLDDYSTALVQTEREFMDTYKSVQPNNIPQAVLDRFDDAVITKILGADTSVAGLKTSELKDLLRYNYINHYRMNFACQFDPRLRAADKLAVRSTGASESYCRMSSEFFNKVNEYVLQHEEEIAVETTYFLWQALGEKAKNNTLTSLSIAFTSIGSILPFASGAVAGVVWMLFSLLYASFSVFGVSSQTMKLVMKGYMTFVDLQLLTLPKNDVQHLIELLPNETRNFSRTSFGKYQIRSHKIIDSILATNDVPPDLRNKLDDLLRFLDECLVRFNERPDNTYAANRIGTYVLNHYDDVYIPLKKTDVLQYRSSVSRFEDLFYTFWRSADFITGGLSMIPGVPSWWTFCQKRTRSAAVFRHQDDPTFPEELVRAIDRVKTLDEPPELFSFLAEYERIFQY